MKKFSVAVAGLFLGVWCVCAEEAKQPPPPRVTLRMQDGSNLVGIPVKSAISMKTVMGRVSVPISILRGIEREQKAGATNSILQFTNGDRLSGTWEGDVFAITTSFGEQQIPLSLLRSVAVRVVGGTAGGQDGLVLHYSFDGEDNAVVPDMSGKNNMGTVVGAKYTPDGKIGAARHVGKQVGFVQAQDQAAWSFGVSPFTICLWFKFETPPIGEQAFIGHDEGGGNQNKWLFGVSNGELYFHTHSSDGSGARIAAFPWAPEVGKWYHVAVTRNGSAYNTYIDGALAAAGSNPAPTPAANAPLTIGHAEGLFVEGVIDEVMIFNRTLSHDEIRQLADTAQ